MQPSSIIRHPTSARDRRAVSLWLVACLGIVACMVLVGGYTRLSGSGLSITSWKPIHGSIPPLNDAQWQEEFAAYQASPQFQKINSDMTVDSFKTIFWPEFIHRLLGRLTGAVFFLPFAIFLFRRSLPKPFAWRLAFIFALGGLQGLIGWLMVKSGLVDRPSVSPVRLALHLATAFTIFALLLWSLLDVLSSPSSHVGEGREHPPLPDPPSLREHPPLPDPPSLRESEFFRAWFAVLSLQIIMGALLAGLHGGLIYNTWPDMDGHYIPAGILESPWYANIPLIQFTHRNLALFLTFTYLIFWLCTRRHHKPNSVIPHSLQDLLPIHTKPRNKCGVTIFAGDFLAITLLLQFALGIITLLHHAPLHLALAHQMTGLLLFSLSVIVLHRSCKSFATPHIS